MTEVQLRPLDEDERPWLEQLLVERWGGTEMLLRGELHDLRGASAVVAERDGERVGLLTYAVRGAECEITSLDSLAEGQGVGTALLQEAGRIARLYGCRRLHLTTTNDNVDALRFYQKRGFVLSELRRDAITNGRRLKPSISWLGDHGIPIRDELELERIL
jgi:GNAT superfamily N-acetyltransferase